MSEAPDLPPQRRTLARRVLSRRSAKAAAAFLALLAVASIIAPWLAPHDPLTQDVSRPFEPFGGDNLLSTDYLGRDVLSRLLYATRTSLLISMGVAALSLVVAVPMGLLAGYHGGRIDGLVMRVADACQSIPALVLALAIVGTMGPGTRNTVAALGIVLAPGLLRVTRAQALAIRGETFIDASRTIGTPTGRILATRVLPNLRAAVVVQVSLLISTCMVAESSLSFLGLGTQPPNPSWGTMLRDAYDRALFVNPEQLLAPALAIGLTVVSINTLADALLDAVGVSRRRVGRPGALGLTSVRRPPDSTGSSAAGPRPDAVPLLSIRDLEVVVDGEEGRTTVVDHVSLDVMPGQAVGLVGESGSGKTMTALSVLRLLPSPPVSIVHGSILVDGDDVLEMSRSDLGRVRGGKVAMVFQDPMTSLTPTLTVGGHLCEVQKLHDGKASRERSLELLEMVGISEPEKRLRQHPHQLSGGMRQRVMIALALASRPRLLIADEPTTALDATVQREILLLLRRLREEMGLALLLVSHDLRVVADLCDEVVVMYAGQVVERTTAGADLGSALHPYARALARLQLNHAAPGVELPTLEGATPDFRRLGPGCRFADRCPNRIERCTEAPVPLLSHSDHLVRCIRTDEPAGGEGRRS